VPATVREHIADHIAQLKNSVPDARASWARDENLHLTIKFLGDTPIARAEALSQAAARAVATIQAFELIVEGCGSFPLHGPARVLWIAINDPSGNLAQLYRELEKECAGEGFAREERVFHPHLTIARLRKPQGARRLAEAHKMLGFEGIAFRVSELRVIRSELLPEGSRHTLISKHALQ
jgi:2'-5' RNA ligase